MLMMLHGHVTHVRLLLFGLFLLMLVLVFLREGRARGEKSARDQRGDSRFQDPPLGSINRPKLGADDARDPARAIPAA